jgi:hypothetical protein
VAIDNPLLVPSISWHTTSSFLGHFVYAADDVPTLKTCKTTAASAILTCTNLETRSKLPEFSGIVVSARVNQYWINAPSLFRSLILNRHCSCDWRQLFSALYHLPGHCLTHTQSFLLSPTRQLWIPVDWQICNMRSSSKPSTWTWTPR